MSHALKAALLACLALAGCATSAPPQPLWRMDTSHLADDRAGVESCMTAPRSDLDRCVLVVQQQCPGYEAPSATQLNQDDELSWTMNQRRACNWRALAAWEDAMSDELHRLRSILRPDLVDTSQRAWRASLLRDVQVAASVFEGGAWEGVAAAQTRAELVARRVIQLETWRRDATEE